MKLAESCPTLILGYEIEVDLVGVMFVPFGENRSVGLKVKRGTHTRALLSEFFFCKKGKQKKEGNIFAFN